MGALLDRYLSVFRRRRRAILVGLLLVTVVLGSGVSGIEGGLAIAEFDHETQATAEAEYIDEHFLTDDRTVTLVVIEGNNTLSRDSLLESLALQEQIRENETVAPTLASDRPTVDVTNVFVESYLRSLGSIGELDLTDIRRTFRTFSEAELEEELPATLEEDGPLLGPGTTVSTLLPVDWDGTAAADARLLLVVHDGDVEDEALFEAQTTVENLASEHVETSDSFVFGEALVEQRASEATGETFAVIGPVAFLVLVAFLLVVYRDLLDVFFTLFGLGVVLLWTAGFVGWLEIELTQLLVAVPWLLVGLGIDYALHVVMRYRTFLDASGGNRVSAMSGALGAVLVAISVTTVTTAAGFLSGGLGPMSSIREFGIVAAFGIVSALLVFGALVPALKLEFEELFDRNANRRPVGTLPLLARVLRLGVIGARRAPVAILVAALLLSTMGAYGATQVDTSTDRTDFYPEEQPDWMTSLPMVEGSSGSLSEQARFLDERFETIGADDRGEILLRGSVTNESGVRAIHTVEQQALAADSVRSDGDSAVHTPFDAVERLAEFNGTIATLLSDADRTGDDRPDGDVTAVFDAAFGYHEESMVSSVYREGDTYQAVRMSIETRSGADPQTTARELRTIAAAADDEPGIEATVTGGQVLTADRQAALLQTLVQSFALALFVTFTLLLALFWVRYRTLSLGLLTVFPVVAALCWLLGTMHLAGIPYNAETSIITGIAIGLGVDYSIHVSTRFQEERGAGDLTDALSRAVQDTGGTLFASAFTTAAAIGVLLFTFVPSLQRFALVMVLVVVYAFVAAVFVLPSLLVLYARWE